MEPRGTLVLPGRGCVGKRYGQSCGAIKGCWFVKSLIGRTLPRLPPIASSRTFSATSELVLSIKKVRVGADCAISQQSPYPPDSGCLKSRINAEGGFLRTISGQQDHRQPSRPHILPT